MTLVDSAIDSLESVFDQEIELLKALARIPSVSSDESHSEDVKRCAQAVAAAFSEAGLEQVELLMTDGAPPYVFGQLLQAGPEAPTILFYAHYDVQPIGREAHWRTVPFEPEEQEDRRLYGRGVADDKAGIVLVLAAIRAWLLSCAKQSPPLPLPVNIKFVVEGEEEIGSDHLEPFLNQYRERLAADVIVLTDTANLATGLPSLTTSLRGMVAADVEVSTLDHPLHSGLWGGPLVDASTALVQLLSKLMNEDGELLIPGLNDDLPALTEVERQALDDLPFDEEEFCADAGLLPGGRLAQNGSSKSAGAYEKIWRQPALAITALQGAPLDSANQLTACARAQLSLRLAPGQDPQRAGEKLREFLLEDPPLGAQVKVELGHAAAGWSTNVEHPCFDAALRALAKGYDATPSLIGCGGSIPFVGPFSQVLGGVPALLLGVEDPPCNAHGENESLNLSDFEKAARSCVYLVDEILKLSA